MSVQNVAILVFYSLGMAIGQVLFKMAAEKASAATASGFFRATLLNGYFFAAACFYAALTVVWVWILMRVPLSRAYPFVVLAFVFTPLLAFLVFGERVTGWYVLGLALVLVGLGVLVVKAN